MEFIDLKSQLKRVKSDILESINDVLNHGQYIMGPEVKELESKLAKYVNQRYCISCSSGTDALLIALMAMDVCPGDAVFTTPFTYVATAEVISLLGATPIFVDIDPKTFNLNTSLIKSKINDKTKAIIPVHLFGQTCNMEKIVEIANKYNLYVIEDNAQALGSKYKFSNSKKQFAGTIGDISTTSFFPSKNLGCYGDGGAIITNSDNLAHKLRGLVNHGMYERYYHDEVGVNSRLDSIQAAILNVKLKYLDKYNNRRQHSAKLYNEALNKFESIETPFVESDPDTHVYHQYTLKVKDGKRDDLAEHLLNNNIPFGIYYPLGFHEQKAYKQEFTNDKDFPVTNKVKNEVISLPMHTELSKSQIKYITNTISSFFE